MRWTSSLAWVSVPDLRVHPARQRYEHMAATETAATVEYVGSHRGFRGVLVVDRDGLVVTYPDLAARLPAPQAAAGS